MIRSLLWKEWHEQWWRIAFGCVIIGATMALGLKVRIIPDENLIESAMVFGMVIMPLLMAMGLVAPERADGTLSALLALPVAPFKVLIVKLLMGVLGCLLPMATAAIATAAIAHGREIRSQQMLILFAGASIFATVMLLWFMAFGVTQPTEARVALVGLAVLIASVCEALVCFVICAWLETIMCFPVALIRAVFLMAGTKSDQHPELSTTMAAQALMAILLLGCTVVRFHRLARARS